MRWAGGWTEAAQRTGSPGLDLPEPLVGPTLQSENGLHGRTMSYWWLVVIVHGQDTPLAIWSRLLFGSGSSDHGLLRRDHCSTLERRDPDARDTLHLNDPPVGCLLHINRQPIRLFVYSEPDLLLGCGRRRRAETVSGRLWMNRQAGRRGGSALPVAILRSVSAIILSIRSSDCFWRSAQPPVLSACGDVCVQDRRGAGALWLPASRRSAWTCTSAIRWSTFLWYRTLCLTLRTLCT